MLSSNGWDHEKTGTTRGTEIQFLYREQIASRAANQITAFEVVH
jgi:hypothetical protein